MTFFPFNLVNSLLQSGNSDMKSLIACKERIRCSWGKIVQERAIMMISC